MPVGEGSTQIRPNQFLEVQLEVVEAAVLEGTELKDGLGVAEVADVVVVVVDESLQPNQPGVAQLDVDVELDDVVEVVVDVVVVVGSLQPNQPGVSHVVVEVVSEVEVVEVVVVVVVVGTGKMLVEVVMTVWVVLSLQPNHPGVSQVVDVMMLVEVVMGPDVVLSSRHPHQPGVLQVSVLEGVVVAVLLLELVVVSEPLLS